MDMVNGYVFLDLLGANVYKKSLGAIKSGKPVLVKDYDQVYYADTIKTATIDDDVVVEITKGGKTITINDANAVSSEGDIQPHLYKYAITLINNDNDTATIFVDSNTTITNENAFSKIYVGAYGIADELGNSGKYIYVIARTENTIDFAIDEGSDFEISTSDEGFDINVTLITQLF